MLKTMLMTLFKLLFGWLEKLSKRWDEPIFNWPLRAILIVALLGLLVGTPEIVQDGGVSPIAPSSIPAERYQGLHVSTADIQCLALNVFHEARGEGIQGMLAVGHVTLNRLVDSDFPNTICGVVKEGGERPHFKCQFSWWCDGKSDDVVGEPESWTLATRIAGLLLSGAIGGDPTGGALWYHTDDRVPQWFANSSKLERNLQIGKHILYKKKPVKLAKN